MDHDSDRGPLDDDALDELLTSAFAQRAHWYEVGDARERAVADWQVSRAASVAGHPDLARRFGARALRQASGLGPFLLGCGHEALARAAAGAGDRKAVVLHLRQARELCAQVEDDEERQVLTADLDSLDRPTG